jgi:hypothetical protein
MPASLVIKLTPRRQHADISFEGGATRDERREVMRLGAFLAPAIADLEAALRLFALVEDEEVSS